MSCINTLIKESIIVGVFASKNEKKSFIALKLTKQSEKKQFYLYNSRAENFIKEFFLLSNALLLSILNKINFHMNSISSA